MCLYPRMLFAAVIANLSLSPTHAKVSDGVIANCGVGYINEVNYKFGAGSEQILATIDWTEKGPFYQECIQGNAHGQVFFSFKWAANDTYIPTSFIHSAYARRAKVALGISARDLQSEVLPNPIVYFTVVEEW